jgi:hypothetical protein
VNTLSEKTACANLASMAECRTIVDSTQKGPLVGAMVGAVVSTGSGAARLALSTETRAARQARIASGAVQFPVLDSSPQSAGRSYAQEAADREVSAAAKTANADVTSATQAGADRSKLKSALKAAPSQTWKDRVEEGRESRLAARAASRLPHLAEDVANAINGVEELVDRQLQSTRGNIAAKTAVNEAAQSSITNLEGILNAISSVRNAGTGTSITHTAESYAKILEFTQAGTGKLAAWDDTLRKELATLD